MCLSIKSDKITVWWLQELEEKRKAKKNKAPCNDQIQAKLIEARVKTIRSQIHKFVNSIWTKEELPAEWKE